MAKNIIYVLHYKTFLLKNELTYVLLLPSQQHPAI